MKYRVTIDQFFDTEKDKDAFIAAVKPILSKASAGVNVGKDNAEMSKARWHRCGHDEGKACEPEQEI